MVEGLFIVIAAVVTATGAVRLDRFFQQIDRRRDLYLEVLTYLDNIAVMIMEQLVTGAPDNRTHLAVEREIVTQQTKLDLLASQPVRSAYSAYRSAWPKVMTAMGGPPPEGSQAKNLPTQLRLGLEAIRPERDALASAMRADLKQRVLERRKT